MTMDAALVFAQQGDWRRVVPAARQAITADPENATAHALLALGLSHLEEGGAVEAGRRAVALEPELSFAQYAFGWALLESGEVDAAERAAREALRLSPDGDEHALLAQVHLKRRKWKEAVETAERGLQTSPEHPGCANVRAVALANLGRSEEAMAGVQDMLAIDPDDAYAHANRGWLLLRQARPDEAMLSFQAALRLDPTLEWARLGMIEAMKARNLAYRLVLRYSFWAGSLSGRAQWFLIIGAYMASRVVRNTLRENPALWPVLGPLLGLYIVFVFGSWIADPLSNLILRLHPIGRMALNRVETIASNIVGVCLLSAIVAGLAFMATGAVPAIVIALVCGLMLVPIGAAVNAHGTNAFKALASGAGLLGLIGLTAIVAAPIDRQVAVMATATFAIGAFFFSFFANYQLLKHR